MIIVISPAKNINEDIQLDNFEVSKPRFDAQSKKLLKQLKTLEPDDIKSLMKISENLSQLNYQRFQSMKFPFKQEEIIPALKAFNGAVYQSIKESDFNTVDWGFAQEKLRILSGFYGLLRPMDGIRPYRLEMGTKLVLGEFNNLYQFWGNKITNKLKADLKENGDNILINLASNEYFKSIDTKTLKADIITPLFKDYKDGKYKMIAIYAKMARGLMSRYIIKNRINNVDDLKLFNTDGYEYNDLLSSEKEWVFTRG